MSITGVHCNALAEMESEPLFVLGKGHLIQALFIIETKMQFFWAAVSYHADLFSLRCVVLMSLR